MAIGILRRRGHKPSPSIVPETVKETRVVTVFYPTPQAELQSIGTEQALTHDRNLAIGPAYEPHVGIQTASDWSRHTVQLTRDEQGLVEMQMHRNRLGLK